MSKPEAFVSPFNEPRYFEPYLACDLFEVFLTLGVWDEISSADIRAFFRNSGIEDDDLRKIAGGIVKTDDAEDAVDALIAEYFRRFRRRKIEYGDFYPYAIKNRLIKRASNGADYTVYEALVVLSRLDVARASPRIRLSLRFEGIASNAVSAILGKSFKVHSGGTGSGSSAHIFSRDKKIKLRRIARWLNYSIDEEFMNDVSDKGGDHGVDVIARLRSDRRSPGSIILFGQCAASNNPDYWKDKYDDARKIEEVIRFPFEPQHALLIPLEYRREDWRWLELTGLKKVLLFDRYRMKEIANDVVSSEVKEILDEIGRDIVSDLDV